MPPPGLTCFRHHSHISQGGLEPPVPALPPSPLPQAMGKAVTYGQRDSRTMKEQRESLPIFKLKQQLIQAVHDNQVGRGGGTKGKCSSARVRSAEFGAGWVVIERER